MKTIKQFSVVALVTFIICFVVIAFVRWELDWMSHIPNLTSSRRLTFVVAVVVKLILDAWILYYLKEKYFDKDLDAEKKAEEAEQEKLKETFN